MINGFSIAGLTLDMIGVVILGFDVITLQNSARKSAASNRQFLEDSFDGLNVYMAPASWLSGSNTEGLFEHDGGIDSVQAQRDFNALQDRVSNAEGAVNDTIGFLADSARYQIEIANKSLRFTIVGLFLIVIGFGLQLIGQIGARV